MRAARVVGAVALVVMAVLVTAIDLRVQLDQGIGIGGAIAVGLVTAITVYIGRRARLGRR